MLISVNNLLIYYSIFLAYKIVSAVRLLNKWITWISRCYRK